MRSKSLKYGLLAALSLALICISSRHLEAGQQVSNIAYCGLDADGGGFCSGTRGAFRQSTDSEKLLSLQKYASNTQSYMSRYAVVDSTETGFKYLSISSSASIYVVQAFDDAVLAQDTTNIYVRWDSSNHITIIQVYDSSDLSN